MLKFIAANPYNITCAQINCPQSTTTISGGMASIIQILMILVGMLAVVFIIVSGIQMSISAGSPQRFERARETLLYAVVGLGVAIGAYAIVTFIAGSVKGGH